MSRIIHENFIQYKEAWRDLLHGQLEQDFQMADPGSRLATNAKVRIHFNRGEMAVILIFGREFLKGELLS